MVEIESCFFNTQSQPFIAIAPNLNPYFITLIRHTNMFSLFLAT